MGQCMLTMRNALRPVGPPVQFVPTLGGHGSAVNKDSTILNFISPHFYTLFRFDESEIATRDREIASR